MEGQELSNLGQMALWLVEHDFGVFPLGAKSKKPATKHGLNDWTDNPSTIIDWWQEHPYCNIGIACGSPSNGLLVIDLDIHEGKGNGAKTLEDWEIAHGKLPETVESITGSGGRHLWFRTDRTGIKPSTNDDLGVDVRCDGSYIVAPPSIHDTTGEPYEWENDPKYYEIATADGNVYDFLDYVQRNGSTVEGMHKENGKFKLPDTIKKGSRDNVLFKYASHLRAIGRSDEEILNAVMGANFTKCDAPLDSKDIERIVKSACKYERGDDASDREIGKPGAKAGAAQNSNEQFRGKRGGLLTNKLGAYIIEHNHVMIIDGAPALWTGTRWDFGTEAISRKTLELADDAKKQDKSEVISYIQDKAPCITSDTSFDGKPYVQFLNGTYDILEDKFVEPEPTMFIIATLPCNLNLDAEWNLADEFLQRVSNNDELVEKVLKEVIGACMCSQRLIATSPMLIGRAGGGRGQASNGKSTYINMIRSILGAQNFSSLDIATLGQRFQASRVVGKIANLGDDIPDGFLRSDELSIFKKLVTGDTIFTDVKGSRGFEFKPSATMVFSMNNIPRLSDTSDGVFRRLSFIPFKRQFRATDTDYDPFISRKLAQKDVIERAALLGLMEVKGLYQRGSFTVIPEMEQEVELLRIDNDSVLNWIAENNITEQSINGRPTQAIYDMYVNYCKDTGEKMYVKKATFTKRVLGKFTNLVIKVAKERSSRKTYKVFSSNDL